METLDTEEFLLVVAQTDDGDWLDDETARNDFLQQRPDQMIPFATVTKSLLELPS